MPRRFRASCRRRTSPRSRPVQAWAACGFSGKRLPTNEEWTAAATGTPTRPTHDVADDSNTGAGPVSAGAPVKTGSRSRCVSTAGAFDMVGNVSEWTMDGHSRARYRGGAWDAGDRYGIAFTQPDVPLTQDNAVGFRCVR
jgi:formylglycine-generating enzyme required for sulfatase activity